MPDAQDPEDPKLVVALGASAGGLEPIQKFVERAPQGAGIAYVLLQHLSPDHPTLMQSLLARHTTMTVVTAEDGMRIEADNIYLLPPRSEMILDEGVLRLEDQERTAGEPLRPIDRFFVSMAEERRNRCVSIVLSGTGSDGAAGTSAVHSVGGLTLVQDGSAAFSGMPDNAVRTGSVVQSLDPSAMPEVILEYARDPEGISIARAARADERQPYGRIIRQLEEGFGLDFGAYKPGTVQRRIARRVELADEENEDEYADRLESDPSELRRLYHDLLIGVTEFFRDERPWQVLESVASDLVAKANDEQRELRAWVVGCATGQEAYTLAMVLLEAVERAGTNTRMRVFATDADQSSIETASAGVYPAEAMQGVSADRRRRFFVQDGEIWRAAPELRRLVTFTTHNLLSEAPFTRLDLVTCRNLLIYLRPESRTRALALLHFSLRVGGVMFLGSSESPEPHGSEFSEVDGRARIFTKSRDIRLLGTQPLSSNAGSRNVLSAPRSVANERLMRAYDDLLAAYGPTGFLIDEHRRILHVLGDAAPVLQAPTGRITGDLLDQIDESLRVPLWGAIQSAFNRLEPVEVEGIQIETDDEMIEGRIVVTPLPDKFNGPSHALVAIEAGRPADAEQRLSPSRMSRVATSPSNANAAADVVFLERELQLTRETLQTTVEELEASNEELVSSNEELQSTNEELQSVNEELHTVNTEYEQKINELTRLTNDLDNLIQSSDVGTLFLSRDLHVRRFTPDVGSTFRLRATDVGRSIEDFADRLRLPDFHARLRRVIEEGHTDEDKIVVDGRHELIRMSPYMVGDEIEGVVVSLVDIDALMQAQLTLQAEKARFESFMARMPMVAWTVDESGRLDYVNEAYRRWTGRSDEELIGRQPHAVLGSSANPAALDVIERSDAEVRANGVSEYDLEIDFGTGSRWMSVVEFAYDYLDRPYVGGAAIDRTESVLAGRHAVQTAQELQELLDVIPDAVWALDDGGVVVRVNTAALAYGGADILGGRPDEYFGSVAAWMTGDLANEVVVERPFGEAGPRFMRVAMSTTSSGGRLIVGADISDLMSVQHALAQQNEAMLQRNTELDQFAHMASHDLRAPIRAISLLSEQALGGDIDLREFAEEAASRAQRMRELIDSLLAFADTGRRSLARTTVPLDDVIESVERDVQAELKTNNGRIEYGDLPEWSIDVVLMRRAIMNLVNNALVHGEADKPVVTISGQVVEGWLRLDVADNGKGFPEVEGVDVFDPFTRGSVKHPGTGMGLAVARRVAQRHGGTISIASTGQDGTIVRILLPAADAEQAPEGAT